MKDIDFYITQICKEVVTNNGFMFIDILFRGQKNSKVIELFIDGESKLSVDDCAMVSREINSKIEIEELIPDSYRLEVSSPGTDKPLKFLKQYPKHINRNFEVTYKNDDGLMNKITAKLIKVENDFLVFNFKNNEIKLNFQEITKAKVIISFS
jgi:ribosome maturation factor RimP